MAGTLAAGQRVGQAGVQREECAAIVQCKARSRRDNPGAKFAVVALYQRNHVAFPVHHRQVRGVVAYGQISSGHGAIRMLRVNQLCALRCPLF